MQRRARTYSFESGGRDSIHVGARRRSRQARGSVPPVPPIEDVRLAPAKGAGDGGYGKGGKDSSAGLGRSTTENDDVHRVPTLHINKRDGQHLVQRKSSKRRKNSHDRVREAELKAMSNFTPLRPATDVWTAGRPMKKDTRRVRTGLGIGFGSGGKLNWDRDLSSDISLPIPESIHSSLSSDSEQISYRISALDALAPKPTLRYSRGGAAPGGSLPQRTSSQRKKLSSKEPIPEATIKAHKRIDDLANDLSAGDLRELMERDQRRRERQRQKEQDRIEKRLARRAEKERLAAAAGSQVSPNLERGVLGREAVGLGIDPTSAVVTSSKRRPSDTSSRDREAQSPVNEKELVTEVPPAPLDVFHRTTSIPLNIHTPDDEHDDILPAQAPSPKLKSGGFLRSKKTRSASPLQDNEKSTTLETVRKGSESSSSRGPMSWASIFRWGNKNRRSSGPSSFSNTSRDSMATSTQQQLPAVAPPPPSATATVPATTGPPRKLSSSVPRRTLSRFREDLPEFPITPPESRLQSPEADTLPPPIMEQDSPPAQETPLIYQKTHFEDQQLETPTSDRHSSAHRDDFEPSPEPPQSMSLASIDSEGSWLSGRLGSRRQSSQLQQPRDSASHSRQSHHRHQHSGGSGETAERVDHDAIADEDVSGITEDEYIGRVAGHSSSHGFAEDFYNRKSIGEPRPSSDEEDEARWGAVGGQTPTVVRADRIKSREGLLNGLGEEDDLETTDLESPISPASAILDEAALQRATSVNLGKGHARHISAGSARLLQLSPRSSIDTKRRRSVDPRV